MTEPPAAALIAAVTVALAVATWLGTFLGGRQRRHETAVTEYQQALAGRINVLESERDDLRQDRDDCRAEVKQMRMDLEARLTSTDRRVATIQGYLETCEAARTALYIERADLERRLRRVPPALADEP